MPPMQWIPATEAQREAVRIAGLEIGVTEKTTNSSERIDEYLRASGLAPGNAWCAAFCAWVIQQVEGLLGLYLGLPYSGWTPIWLQADRVDICAGNPVLIAPGMAFLIYYSHLGRVGHIGFIEGPDPDNPERVITIEGNTNDDGSREGIAVVRRSRNKSQIYALIDFGDRGDLFG